MLNRTGNRWSLYPHKVRYKSFGEEREDWALPNKKTWTEMANNHEHIEIIEFIEVDITEDVQFRFGQIKNMPESPHSVYVDYVESGDLSNEVELPTNHLFNIIRLRKENTWLKAKANANAESADFHEELIVEMAMKIY